MFARLLDSSYRPEVRESVGSLTAAKIVGNSAVRFAPPLIATIASGLDVSLTTVGTALAVADFSGLSGPLIARITDSWPRRRAMVVGLGVMVVGALLAATAISIVQLAAGLVLLVTGKLALDVNVVGWISDRVDYAKLGRAVGLTETAWALALLSGVVVMALVAGLVSWRWSYAIVAVALVAAAAVLATRLPNEVRHEQLRHQVRVSPARLGRGWWVAIGTFAMASASQAVFVTFGTWLEDDHGFSTSGVAAVVFGLGAVELFAATATMRYSDRWGKERAIAIGAATMIPGGVMLTLAHDQLALGLIAVSLFILAFEFAIVGTLSLASSLVAGAASAGVGITVAAATLGRSAMSPLVTASYSAHGIWLVGLIAGIAALISTLSFVAFARTGTGTGNDNGTGSGAAQPQPA